MCVRALTSGRVQYDMCANCWDKVGEKHAAHNFVKLTSAANLKLLAPYAPKTIHRNVVCDGCDRGIIGCVVCRGIITCI